MDMFPVHYKNYTSQKRIIINRGGTSSGKTGSLLRLCFVWLLSGKVDDVEMFPRGVLSIVRKYSSSLTKSVQRDFDDIIDQYGFTGKIEINKTEKTYRYQGRMIEFFGVDDPQKVRGPRRDILYCNEANELTWEDFFQLQIRTKYKVYIDFNPDDEDVWINTELEQKRAISDKDVDVIVSTYMDNPALDDVIVKEIERLKDVDPVYWRVYGEGQYGRMEGLVLPNWTEIDRVPDNAELIAHGQDFGFTNDPSATIGVYKYDGAIILDEEIYAPGLTNQDLCRMYDSNGIGMNDEIYADSSEPKSIEEISRSGYNIRPVEKGADSVKFGISIMKQYKILVTARSINLKKELKKYIWKKDRTGRSLNEPIDVFNHAIDAVRYVFMMKLKKSEPMQEAKIYFI